MTLRMGNSQLEQTRLCAKPVKRLWFTGLPVAWFVHDQDQMSRIGVISPTIEVAISC